MLPVLAKYMYVFLLLKNVNCVCVNDPIIVISIFVWKLHLQNRKY